MRLLELYEEIKRGPGEVIPDPQTSTGEESNAQLPENGTRGTQKATGRLLPRQEELRESLGTELCEETDSFPLPDAHDVQELMWAAADAVRSGTPIPETCYLLGWSTIERLKARPEAANNEAVTPRDELRLAGARLSDRQMEELYERHLRGASIPELITPWQEWGYKSEETARRSLWNRFRVLEKLRKKHPWRHSFKREAA